MKRFAESQSLFSRALRVSNVCFERALMLRNRDCLSRFLGNAFAGEMTVNSGTLTTVISGNHEIKEHTAEFAWSGSFKTRSFPGKKGSFKRFS